MKNRSLARYNAEHVGTVPTMRDDQESYDRMIARAFALGEADAADALYRAGAGVPVEDVRRPDLSGEWADGRTPQSLGEDLGLGEDQRDWTDDVCDAYEQGVEARMLGEDLAREDVA